MTDAQPPAAEGGPILEAWTREEFVELVFEAEVPVVVDFWAAWCQPCIAMAPVFAALAEAHPEVRFVKVDTDRAPDIARAVGIKSMPTFGFYWRGELQDVFVGARTRKQLEQRIEALAAKAAGKGLLARLFGR